MAAKNGFTETADIPRGLKGQVTQLARLREQYAAHLAEMADVADQITRLEKRVKESAVADEITFEYRGLQVVYTRGGKTVSVDRKALEKDAVADPELEKYFVEGERAGYAYIREIKA